MFLSPSDARCKVTEKSPIDVRKLIVWEPLKLKPSINYNLPPVSLSTLKTYFKQTRTESGQPRRYAIINIINIIILHNLHFKIPKQTNLFYIKVGPFDATKTFVCLATMTRNMSGEALTKPKTIPNQS